MYLDISQNKVKITNPEKIFWPKSNIKKGDMINYYIKVYPHIKKYLTDRPLSLKIYPDGINGDSFFRKRCPEYAPEWLTTAKIPSGKKNIINWITVNTLADLIWVANHGSIELHGWFSKATTPTKPDFAVFDLDPGKNTTINNLIDITLLIKEILDSLKIKSFVKTSGKRGLHIFIPLNTVHSYSYVKKFLKNIALLVIDRKSEITTIEWRKNKRKGKLHIDFRQNSRGKTIPVPYSLRPTTHATVSTPLYWSELNYNLKIENYNISNTHSRIKSKNNPWKDIFNLKQSLPEF